MNQKKPAVGNDINILSRLVSEKRVLWVDDWLTQIIPIVSELENDEFRFFHGPSEDTLVGEVKFVSRIAGYEMAYRFDGETEQVPDMIEYHWNDMLRSNGRLRDLIKDHLNKMIKSNEPPRSSTLPFYGIIRYAFLLGLILGIRDRWFGLPNRPIYCRCEGKGGTARGPNREDKFIKVYCPGDK